MNIRKIFTIILINIVATINVFCQQTKNMTFSSPIILTPIIELARTHYKDDPKLRQPVKMPQLKITMVVEQFAPNEEQKKGFDEFLKLSFKEISNVNFLIFKKNKFVKQLIVIKAESGKTLKTKFQRDLNVLTKNIVETKKNSQYIKKTQDTLKKLFQAEDFLTNFSVGKYVLTCDIRILKYNSYGVINIDNFPYKYGFMYGKKNSLNNSWLKPEKKAFPLFTITFYDYITQGALFDEKALNGHIFYFYPNQGLKSMTNLKNGKQHDVDVWSMNGNKTRKILFKKWAKTLFKVKEY